MRTVIADKRWAEKYPEIGTGPVAAEPLISSEHFELEREKNFSADLAEYRAGRGDPESRRLYCQRPDYVSRLGPDHSGQGRRGPGLS